MAEGETGYKWWVRYVLVPVITGGGIIALLVANYLQRQSNTAPVPTKPTPIASAPTTPSTTPPGSQATRTSTNEAQALSSRWLAALFSGNVDQLIELSTTPFFVQRGLIVSSQFDLRTQYTKFASHFAGRTPEVRSTTIRNIQELQQTDSSFGQFANVLGLSLTDQVVQLKLRWPGRTIDDGAMLLTRRTDNTIKVVGFHID